MLYIWHGRKCCAACNPACCCCCVPTALPPWRPPLCQVSQAAVIHTAKKLCKLTIYSKHTTQNSRELVMQVCGAPTSIHLSSHLRPLCKNPVREHSLRVFRAVCEQLSISADCCGCSRQQQTACLVTGSSSTQKSALAHAAFPGRPVPGSLSNRRAQMQHLESTSASVAAAAAGLAPCTVAVMAGSTPAGPPRSSFMPCGGR